MGSDWRFRSSRAARSQRSALAGTSGRTRLGPGHDVAGLRLEREVIHDPRAAHPRAVPLRTGLAELFGFPLRHRDRRRPVGPHEPVANKAGLRAEDGNALGLDLTKDTFRFRRVEIDVP